MKKAKIFGRSGWLVEAGENRCLFASIDEGVHKGHAYKKIRMAKSFKRKKRKKSEVDQFRIESRELSATELEKGITPNWIGFHPTQIKSAIELLRQIHKDFYGSEYGQAEEVDAVLTEEDEVEALLKRRGGKV